MSNTEELKKMLINFFQKMNEWEKYCEKINDDNSLTHEDKVKIRKDKVQLIFNQFCTKKDRKTGRPNVIFYGINGSYEYDPDMEQIIGIEFENQKKCIANTIKDDDGFDEKLTYTLVFKDNQWLIDSKKRYSSWKNKWENISL